FLNPGAWPARNLLAQRYPSPLKIAVVGAGVGGLSVAVALRLQGHKVELYERPDHGRGGSALVNLGPNSNGLIRRWGLCAETFGGSEMLSLAELGAAGDERRCKDFSVLNKRWQHPWHLVPRARLSERLREIATAEDGLGIPVTVCATVGAVSLDSVAGCLAFRPETPATFDVIIGADGIHSETREAIGQGNTHRLGSGGLAFDFTIPRDVVLNDPTTRPLLDRHHTVTTWHGDDGLRVDMYNLGGDEALYFTLVCLDAESLSEGNKLESFDPVLELLRGFDPAVKQLVRKVHPAQLKAQPLLGMEKLPSWVNGKLALLGDAAHPFPSFHGQGTAQAIEDSAALATLYEKIRYDRAHQLQDAEQNGAGADAMDAAPAFRRMPISFGACPGPRQDGFGNPYGSHAERTFLKASIMFKTSRTYLQSFLPTPSFRFRSPATIAYASILVTTVGNMSWLGGRGYTHFGVYLHDVEYGRRDGTAVYGTYLPAMFENLADPIISGRDELGMNKVYCDIDVDNKTDSYSARLSWRGAEFLNIRLDDLSSVPPESLKEMPADAAAQDYGLLTYKYVPATGEPGKADVEYACVIPHAEEARVAQQTVRSLAWAHQPKVTFEEGDWESLPTLHHISSALAAMPIYGFVFSKVEEGVGVADMSSCRRIE
ncbi:hypothetical protein B0H67DRAFT_595901, partial [Lasiosphaeris hirsuta]